MPALLWARHAIALGRGQAAPPPALPVTNPELYLLAARAAFAAGGTEALARFLENEAPPAFAAHPEVRVLAEILEPDAGTGGEPLAAYVRGVRARLAGDEGQALSALAAALDGHGDACRAAGEYVAAVEAAKRAVDGTLFAPLRAKNARCINLPGVTAAGTVVPPKASRRRDRARSLPSRRDPLRGRSSTSGPP